MDHELFSGSRVGRSHRENQDQAFSRVITTGNGNIYILGVADGVSQTPYGGSLSRWLAGSIKNDEIPVADTKPLSDQVLDYLKRLHATFMTKFAAMPDMLASATTLSIAAIQGDRAECFWCGDSPIYHSRKEADGFATTQISTPDIVVGALTSAFTGIFCPPHHKQLILAAGDILTLATDGLRHRPDNLSQVYADEGVNQQTIDHMIEHSVRFQGSDDTSLAVAYRTH